MHYKSCSSFFARAVVLLYSKSERDWCVLRSELDGLFCTGSASDLGTWLSEHRSLYFRPIKHRRSLALICYEACLTLGDALSLERFHKSGRTSAICGCVSRDFSPTLGTTS
jgi:predicted GIY-YIG superfamily endonuclease